MRDEGELVRFLGDAILQRNLNIEPGNPIMSARINHVGHFAFIMLRSKEEATRAMELAGLQCFGNTLRVDRPRGYAARAGGAPGGGGGGAGGHGGGGYQQMDETQMIQAAFAAVPNINIPAMSRDELKRRLEASIAKYGESTSVVLLENLNNATVEEVESEVRKYGNVSGVRQSPDKPGVFIVKMASIQDAEKLIQIKRTFNRIAVKATFRPLAEWTALTT